MKWYQYAIVGLFVAITAGLILRWLDKKSDQHGGLIPALKYGSTYCWQVIAYKCVGCVAFNRFKILLCFLYPIEKLAMKDPKHWRLSRFMPKPICRQCCEKVIAMQPQPADREDAIGAWVCVACNLKTDVKSGECSPYVIRRGKTVEEERSRWLPDLEGPWLG